MANYGTYVSFETLKTHIGLASTDTADDDLLRDVCKTASLLFDQWTGRRFYPRIETRYYDIPEETAELVLDDDLLALTTFTTDNGNVTLTDGTHFYKMRWDDYDHTPYDRLVMADDGAYPNLLWSTSRQRSQVVTGHWGYHDDWSNAWEDSQDTVENNPLTAAGTSITVNDADGADLFGVTPRFKVQQLLQIESEYVYVTAKNTTTNALTVVRGVNGTTAAEHAQNTTISIYKPMWEIVETLKLLAKWIYQRRESTNNDEMSSIAVGGSIVVPAVVPGAVHRAVTRFKPGQDWIA
jgi:hypothetical protein